MATAYKNLAKRDKKQAKLTVTVGAELFTGLAARSIRSPVPGSRS